VLQSHQPTPSSTHTCPAAWLGGGALQKHSASKIANVSLGKRKQPATHTPFLRGRQQCTSEGAQPPHTSTHCRSVREAFCLHHTRPHHFSPACLHTANKQAGELVYMTWRPCTRTWRTHIYMNLQQSQAHVQKHTQEGPSSCRAPTVSYLSLTNTHNHIIT
jgi:hypothetical protein